MLAGTKVEFNPNGTVKADPVTYQTAEPDIFVGGDAYTGQKFAIDAIAAGKQGAVSLHRWVQHATLTVGRDRRRFIELDKENALIAVDSYDNTPRQQIGYTLEIKPTSRALPRKYGIIGMLALRPPQRCMKKGCAWRNIWQKGRQSNDKD